MTTKLTQFLGALMLLGSLCGAHAASISLVPTSPVTATTAGDLVTFDVFMDFSSNSNGLGSDTTLGGGFDIVFDATALQFVSQTSAALGDPDFARDPDVLTGRLESWAFGSFSALTGPALVGSVAFSVLATGPASSFVATTATSGIAGPFVSGVDFATFLNVDYNQIEVSRVPVPAAVWLMLSGLGALVRIGRRAA